jgi:hypothetical protein
MSSGLGIALLLLATGDSPVALEGLAGVGGGYEGNVTLAAAGQPTSGSAVAAAWAGLGVGWDPGRETHLSAGLRYDGALYPGATDLNRNAGWVDLLWIQEIWEPLAVIVAAAGGWSWYGDPARSGPGLLLRGSLRVKPLDWLAVRAGYAYAQRWAEDEAYSTSSSRVFGSVEGRVAAGVYLGLGYSWQTGDQTFYASVPSTPALASPGAAGPAMGAGPGGGPGAGQGTGGSTHQGSGVFENLVPYRASTTDSTLTPTFEAGVWEGLYLFASYSYTWGSSLEGTYTAQFALGGAGYRF